MEVIHAWGMTEMSPLGTVCTMKPAYAGLTGEERLDIEQMQGHTPFLVEMKITDDTGKRLPWDGKTFRPTEGTRAGGRSRVLQGRGQYPRCGRLVCHRRRGNDRSPRLHAHH